MSTAAKICGVCIGIVALLLAAPSVDARATHHDKPRRRASAGAARGHPLARRASGGATPVSVLAPTPYMGWDSYFAFGSHYDEATILEQASQMRTRGLVRDGYTYLWLDVGWWQGTRGAAGEITVSPAQWPHGMAWLDGRAARGGAARGPLLGRRHQRLRGAGAG